MILPFISSLFVLAASLPDPKGATPHTAALRPSSNPETEAHAQPNANGRKACAYGCLSAIEAVTFADMVAPRAGLAAEFDMPIAAVGEQDGRFYLNSEEDYRERNCLTIVLSPYVVRALIGSTDLAMLSQKMVGKRVAVQGIARRVRIDLSEDARPTGKYYYQVHVVVNDPRQIVIN